MIYNFVVMETFGAWLLRHRKIAGLKQSDIATRAHISVSYVSTLEREQPHSITGEKIMPDRAKVAAIAKAVGGDENEALALCGYAPQNGDRIPQPIRDALGSAHNITEKDAELIANFIKMLDEK